MIPATIISEAIKELWDAVEYYERQSPGLGLDFELEIKSAVEIIQRFPEISRQREDFTRRYLIKRFPYLIIYLYHRDRLWIIAIAHCKRKPEYWSERIATE